GEDLEHRDIKEAGDHDMHMLAARHLQPVAGEHRRGEQRCGSDSGAGDAQAPRRNFAQGDRRGNPVEAPGKSEQDDQELGRARGIGLQGKSRSIRENMNPALAEVAKRHASAWAPEWRGMSALQTRRKRLRLVSPPPLTMLHRSPPYVS